MEEPCAVRRKRTVPRHFWAPLALFLVLVVGLLPLGFKSYEISVPGAEALACSTGHFYTGARTYDIDSANGNGASAAWEEQNYVVYDSANGFVISVMWVVMRNSDRWAEVGFGRALYAPYYGNHFYRAAQNNSGYFEQKINKATGGAHTWHTYKIQYNSLSQVWQTYIDGTSYGGWTNYASSAVRIDIGNEVTSNCSTVHTTYFGSPSTFSSYAFKYRTSGGVWTTWGSGSEFVSSPYHSEWLTYAIYRRGWGP